MIKPKPKPKPKHYDASMEVCNICNTGSRQTIEHIDISLLDSQLPPPIPKISQFGKGVVELPSVRPTTEVNLLRYLLSTQM